MKSEAHCVSARSLLSYCYLLLLFLSPTGAFDAKAQSVAITMNGSGLASLQYGGVDFLAYGDFRLNQVAFDNGDGTVTLGTTTNTVSIQGTRQIRNYDWGGATIDYTTTGNRLTITVAIQNRNGKPIKRVWFEPLGLKFPATVPEYDGNTPLLASTLDQPVLQKMSYGSGAVVFAVDDVAKPLYAGFPWATDKPTNRTFPLALNTDKVFMYPDSAPTITRAIASGATDTYTISLRFGAANATPNSLAADVLQNYVTAFPQTVNWPDRRPIGMMILGTAAAGWSTNPRGWFLDPTIDVTTAAGRAAFKTRVLNSAQGGVSLLKDMNAQGMVMWDIEGEQYSHPTTYICDPKTAAQLAPEMDAIADEYFKVFRDAGLRVGVCIRPQRLVINGTPDQQVASSNTEVTQLLIDKARYAHDRWGATLFYVDSNVNSYTDGSAITPGVFRTLQAALPDSLFIPEHSVTQYWATSAPYKEMRQGYFSTPPDVKSIYPNAFTVLAAHDVPLANYFNTLVSSVQAGDVLMFRAWFDDQPTNGTVKQIYQQAVRVAVTLSAPSSSITSGQSVTLTPTVTGTSNTQVTWSLSAALGSISATGVYTAPVVTSTQSVTVTATSVADPRQFAKWTFTVNPVSTPTTSAAIRVNAGGASFVDARGQTWDADRGFTGGTAYTTPTNVSGTTSQALYQTERWGNFDYRFPIANGSYTVTLKFAELYVTGPGQRIFSVQINGSTVLNNFDLFAAAGGFGKAYDQTFPLTVTNSEILLHFTGIVNNASVRGIEIVPVNTTAPAFRINVGGNQWIGANGYVWAADQRFTGGSTYQNGGASIAGTPDPALYQSHRYGSFRYDVPVSNGTHTVLLKFAEIYFTQPGQRVFSVSINGQQVLTNFDPVAAGGPGQAVDRLFTIPVTNGSISIIFTPVVENPMVSAIEII